MTRGLWNGSWALVLLLVVGGLVFAGLGQASIYAAIVMLPSMAQALSHPWGLALRDASPDT